MPLPLTSISEVCVELMSSDKALSSAPAHIEFLYSDQCRSGSPQYLLSVSRKSGVDVTDCVMEA